MTVSKGITVGELIAILQTIPPDYEVRYVDHEIGDTHALDADQVNEDSGRVVIG